MALQSFANGWGAVLWPGPMYPVAEGNPTGSTIDAVGESIAFVGRLHLPGGPGSSKTLSTGKIHYKSGVVTFANAGTTLKAGVQDVAATGLEDGTYDVSGTVTGGGGSPTSNNLNSITMATGTKTITHGDLIAVVIEMTARGGADSVVVQRNNNAGSMPYCTTDTGAGPAKSSTTPIVTIEFDDGTMGWLGTSSFACLLETSAAVNTGTTPDEIALVFRLPIAATLAGTILDLASIAATDDFEVILYTDPLGTPVAARTVTVDADLIGLTAGFFEAMFATTLALAANTDYGIALRPTTANSLTYQSIAFGNSNLRKPTTLGTNWCLATRSDQTGAFSQDTTRIPKIGIILSQFDDGASAGGTTIAGTPMLRGMVG